jgi:hypothetical protein
MRLGGTSLARSVDWQAYAEKAVCQPGRLGRFGWLAKKLTKTHDIFEEYAHYRRQCNLWIRTQHLPRIISEDFDTRRDTAFPAGDPIHGA